MIINHKILEIIDKVLMNYILIVSILLLFSFTNIVCQTNNGSKKNIIELDSEKGFIGSTDNPYHRYREMAFSATPKQLELELNDSTIDVYGCIVEWGFKSNVVTVVAFKTGDVSMYLLSGQIHIGGSSHSNLRIAGLNLLQEIRSKLSDTKLIYEEHKQLPPADIVTSYLISNKEMFFASEKYNNFEDNNSKWDKSFSFVNDIISGYRQLVENE